MSWRILNDRIINAYAEFGELGRFKILWKAPTIKNSLLLITKTALKGDKIDTPMTERDREPNINHHCYSWTQITRRFRKILACALVYQVELSSTTPWVNMDGKVGQRLVQIWKGETAGDIVCDT